MNRFLRFPIARHGPKPLPIDDADCEDGIKLHRHFESAARWAFEAKKITGEDQVISRGYGEKFSYSLSKAEEPGFDKLYSMFTAAWTCWLEISIAQQVSKGITAFRGQAS